MEEWRQIKGFENYSVSDFGNIKNNITNKVLHLFTFKMPNINALFIKKNNTKINYNV
jgi:hypothetical protein